MTQSTKNSPLQPSEISFFTSISVRNFKAVKNITIPLKRITILVGPNGCGKSSSLQAIHWATRSSSYIKRKNTSTLISFDHLDYVPSSDLLEMLHGGILKTEKKSPSIETIFKYTNKEEQEYQATISIRAARNRAGISVGINGKEGVTPFKQRETFITTYIPGLSGLAEKETILAQPALRRQASSGNAGGTLRNILYQIKNSDNKEDIEYLNNLINEIHPNIEIDVSFDEKEDYYISGTIKDTKSQLKKPLETAATGILQTIQIFSYLIFFNPKIMLIDEPDSHLHPDKQERLIETLEKASSHHNTQIIMTTHSPHLVQAASPEVALIWMKGGEIIPEEHDTISRLLGWRGLDKSALFFVEDEIVTPIRNIVRQWPHLSTRISICPCFGVKNLPSAGFLKGFLKNGNHNIGIIIHRDNDFMVEDEIAAWHDKYQKGNIHLWVTKNVDVEYYFCDKKYISTLFEVEEEKAQSWIDKAKEMLGDGRDTFLNKRRENVNAFPKLYRNGGSPNAEKLFSKYKKESINTLMGKELHKQICHVISKERKDSFLLRNFTITENFHIAPNLKDIIEKAISK